MCDSRGDSTGPWIGLSGTPPTMAWSDGTDVDYENWAPNKPNVTGVSCVRLQPKASDKWGDYRCDVSRKCICRLGE